MTNSENTNLSGIYIHVPFCQSRCIYCDFYSTVYGEDFKDRYVERLLKEMADRKNEVDSQVDSIYVGGRNAFLFAYWPHRENDESSYSKLLFGR